MSTGLISSLIWLINTVIQIYIYIVIAAAIVSWLVSFGVVDTRNRLVWSIGDFLYRATEPALRPIRNVLPNMGGIDISPILLILLLVFTQRILNSVLIAVVTHSWQPVVF